jgi:hypothetical protein
MTYGSAIQAIKESLGHQNFGTDKRYGEKVRFLFLLMCCSVVGCPEMRSSG